MADVLVYVGDADVCAYVDDERVGGVGWGVGGGAGRWRGEGEEGVRRVRE